MSDYWSWDARGSVRSQFSSTAASLPCLVSWACETFFLIGCSICVPISRVVLGYHTVDQVVAGAILGLFYGGITHLFGWICRRVRWGSKQVSLLECLIASRIGWLLALNKDPLACSWFPPKLVIPSELLHSSDSKQA